MSAALFLPSALRVFFGTLANAASVGAKTVYLVLPDSVLASPAALTSLISVLKSPAALAVWTMSLLGAADAAGAANAAAAMMASSAMVRRFMWCTSGRDGRSAYEREAACGWRS